MKCNAERLISALVGAELVAEHKHTAECSGQRKDLYVVTVSRNYGSGGAAVAQLLADRLGVRCCDRDILQEVARRAHVDISLVKTLDEHVKQIKGDWWQSLMSGKTLSQEQYFHHLVKVLLSISRTGGVIVGRGAHLVLGSCLAFRVRVVGTLPYCSRRIAERENLDSEAARQHTLEVDGERSAYIRKLFGSDIDDATAYDLVVNSDRFTVEEMVDIILFGMRAAGYVLPENLQRAASR
ncbi:cytidylate kinase-like family protein [Thiogranum longum]